MNPVCIWLVDDVGGDSTWQSDCGMMFQFEDEGPMFNNFKFCPGCGKDLKEEYTSEKDA